MAAPKPPRSRIPMAVKVVYTAFVAVLVRYYLQAYGPTNFCYFCDVALLMTVPAVWLENSLLVSAPAVGIVLPQMVWVVDFFSTATGHPLTGMTGYMFDRTLPLFIRFLSFFHFWLPFFLLWLLVCLGYDRRGFVLWSVIGWGLMIVSFTMLPPPPAPEGKAWMPVNVNYVFGFSARGPQTWMSPVLYLLLFATVLQVAVFWPTHRLLGWWFPPADAKRPGSWHGATTVAHRMD
jgi:hypothetical protein